MLSRPHALDKPLDVGDREPHRPAGAQLRQLVGTCEAQDRGPPEARIRITP